MTRDDPSLVDGLVQLSFTVQGILNRIAAGHELSMTQFRLLGILRDREPGMLQLAGHLGLDKSSVTGLVDRAEKRGLVRRSQRPNDGRAISVAITPAGRRLAELGEKEVNRQLAVLLSTLSATERKALTTIATRLVS